MADLRHSQDAHLQRLKQSCQQPHEVGESVTRIEALDRQVESVPGPRVRLAAVSTGPTSYLL
jgi:hypothetical protein